jgi:hypothetical protein
MKGVIASCLGNLVQEKFGKDKWEEVLEQAGLNRRTQFLSTQDIEDAMVMKVVESVCKILGITLLQAADAFGEYWINTFAPKIYTVHFRNKKSSKDFLLDMDNVHATVTKTMPLARPPRFSYEWKNDNTLLMTYKSHRGLIDFVMGLVKGVGKYYKENFKVTPLGNSRVQIIFP